jgi:polyamine oxidase
MAEPSAAAAAAAAPVPQRKFPAVGGGSHQVVVIVGAGIAGIYAAAELLRLGWPAPSLHIFEAADCAGGRLRTETIHLNSSDDTISYDVGGAWIHGTENSPLSELAKELKIKLRPIAEANPWMNPVSMPCAAYVSGKKVSREDWRRAGELHEDLMRRVRDMALDMGEDTAYPLSSAIESILLTSQFESVSTLHLSCIRLMLHLCECWMGGSLHELQLAEFAADPSGGFGDHPGSHCLPVGGMQQFVSRLIDRDVRIRDQCLTLGARVTKVEYGDDIDDVQVCVVHGGEEKILSAQAIIISCPICALGGGGQRSKGASQLTFSPPLPADKVEALTRMRMAAYKKVLLQFDECFWPPHEPFIAIYFEGKALLLDNLQATHGFAALEAVLVGGDGWDHVDVNDDSLALLVMNGLKSALGAEKCAAGPTSVHVSRWEESENFKGAYSLYAVGTQPTDVDSLSAPVGRRLFFCGEATSVDYAGSVHGALSSAMRCVDELWMAWKG